MYDYYEHDLWYQFLATPDLLFIIQFWQAGGHAQFKGITIPVLYPSEGR